MKTELKAKFLQHLNQKKQDEGFTLIELLVVIIIIGILAAIALPSFLNQANKAKQSEAKSYVGSMNRAQQAFYLEKNYMASNADFGKLGLGIATQTTNYKYVIKDGATASTVATGTQVTSQAQPLNTKGPLKAYIGGVNIGTIQGTGEATTLAALCEGKLAPVNNGPTGGDSATYNTTNGPQCPGTYENLGQQ
jgi:prepilin-type N-terminal cleavage/methylation domain-containing protein